jgi:hypothetical protein
MNVETNVQGDARDGHQNGRQKFFETLVEHRRALEREFEVELLDSPRGSETVEERLARAYPSVGLEAALAEQRRQFVQRMTSRAHLAWRPRGE